MNSFGNPENNASIVSKTIRLAPICSTAYAKRINNPSRSNSPVSSISDFFPYIYIQLQISSDLQVSLDQYLVMQNFFQVLLVFLQMIQKSGFTIFQHHEQEIAWQILFYHILQNHKLMWSTFR